MANEGKIITINESDFSVAKSPFTKKKRAPTAGKVGGIKIKSILPPKKKEATLKTRSILNMIRKHQKERKEKDEPEETDDNEPFDNEFTKAKEYLEHLTKKTEMSNPNKTIKNRNSHASMTPLFGYENVSLEFPPPNTLPLSNIVPSNTHIKGPLYGCMKNGTLPTYRTYMNKTQKAVPNGTGLALGTAPVVLPFSENITDVIKNVSARKQLEAFKHNMVSQKPKIMRQKKTMRRSYKVGRSKTAPKVGVLISNKTLRNDISTKKHTLKQVSIDEVKKHLIKHGLIKVGSTAPNDVLRKMYESTMLICGEVQNHNPENTLHNFLNSQ